jgi:hypothetical protein
MTEEKPLETDHLTIYIDFLGSSEAATSWPQAKRDEFITLLRNVAALRGEFDIAGTPTQTGNQVTVRPAVSTFSDHIVISYPIESLGADVSVGMVLMMANRLIGAIASEAMKLSLLIRGGATVGPLHHSSGVIFGQGLVEAHQLESRVAIYPRVVVSRRIYSNPHLTSITVLEDADGIRHLNYFFHMLWASGGEPGDKFMENLKAWLGSCDRTISENIATFESQERWNKLAKWGWLKKRLDDLRAANPQLFS